MILANHGIIASSGGVTSTLNESLYSVYNAENNANDSFGSNNGTPVGGLTYTTGKIGQAFNFNGTNSYVNIGDNLDLGLSSWSYSMWFNCSNIYTDEAIFSKSIAAAQTGRLWLQFIQSGGQGRLRWNFDALSGVNQINCESVTVFNNNTWYHVTVILDRSSNMKMYINGVPETLSIVSGTNNLTPYALTNYNTTNPFRIGAYTGADNTSAINFFTGKIDAFNVWNRVLTATEATQLYNSGNGKQYPF